jgi:tetratricopeptide (TPR) repeat protein
MKQVAPDFDSTKPLAIVNAVKLESRMRLGKAKLAAQRGNLEVAMQEFQAAAEAWPGNPDLETNASTFFAAQEIGNQSLAEFDRLVAEKNYRMIFEKQLAFAPAMKDDTKRQDQLRDALEKIKGAEMATEKANLLRVNGDVFGAWETVELAVADLPGDIKLNALRGELAGKGAEFVAAVNKAKDAEARKELGFSLSWYAVAQRYYPASRMANEAIERISRELLNEGSGAL